MKKTISLILALGLFIPSLLFAAAATVSSVNRISLGNFAAVSGIVSPNSGDTVSTGLRAVIYFQMESNPSSDTAPGAISASFYWTASGGTVTVHPATNATRYRFFAIGTP